MFSIRLDHWRTMLGIIITQGVLMAEEDTSSLPVPETQFNGSEGERLGQLGVTYTDKCLFSKRIRTRDRSITRLSVARSNH